MQIRGYSRTGDRAAVPPAHAWVAPTPEHPVHGTVTVPGSKSLTNRELLLAALASGPSTLHAPLHSRDTALMIEALRRLGTRIEPLEPPPAVATTLPGALPAGLAPASDPASDPDTGDLLVIPAETFRGAVSIDCGLAGTVMRFVPPVAALALGPVGFDGDAQARRRPMGPLIEGLRQLGVTVADDGRGRLPFTVHGEGRIRAGHVRIDASASSQFVSGLLLAAARYEGDTVIEHVGGTLPSLPHIEMTVATLAEHGVTVHRAGPTAWRVPEQSIAGADVRLEPDLSNAAPFLAAALVTGGSVAVPDWPAHTTQVGALLPELLGAFGARSELVDGTLTVHGDGPVHGADLDLSAAGELAPTIAAVAALADSPTTLRGIAHLRGHETDRLAALESDLHALGGDVHQTDDGLVIAPAVLHGGEWKAFADHRMATAGAVIGLVVPEVRVDDIQATAKTLPGFARMWARLIDPEPTGLADVPVEAR